MSNHKKINLDADSGKIVSDEFAAANPESVVAVKRMHKLTKLFDEARLGNDISKRVAKLTDREKGEVAQLFNKFVLNQWF